MGQPVLNGQEEDILDILATVRIIAVVGLSSKPDRPSYDVSAYMQRQGYRIVPVNPRETEVLGERAYPSLSDIPFPVDVVNVFRRADLTPPIAEEAVRIGAKALWLQLGIANDEAAEIARQGGLKVVMDRCIKVEHRRLRGRLPRPGADAAP